IQGQLSTGPPVVMKIERPVCRLIGLAVVVIDKAPGRLAEQQRGQSLSQVVGRTRRVVEWAACVSRVEHEITRSGPETPVYATVSPEINTESDSMGPVLAVNVSEDRMDISGKKPVSLTTLVN